MGQQCIRFGKRGQQARSGWNIFLAAAIFLFVGARDAAAQDPSARENTARRETPYLQPSAAQTSRQMGRPGADIVADNLDRVAASAEEILEVVNREPGLMVELKRLLAQDAGANGQLLEESDLSEAAPANGCTRICICACWLRDCCSATATCFPR